MSEEKYNDFRDLEVWQRCKGIRNKVWELCKDFPAEEKYRLSDQMVELRGPRPQILLKVMAASIIRRTSNFAGNPEDRFMS